MSRIIFLLGISFFAHAQISRDTLNIQTIDGKEFVIHVVRQGETLYSISRSYNASISSVLQYNPEAESGTIEIGQVLKVPYVLPSVSLASQPATHQVVSGETLFSIARKYGVTIGQLREWNKLERDAINVGQSIIVKQPDTTLTAAVPQDPKAASHVHTVNAGETLYSLSRQYNVSVGDLMRWNNLSSTSLNVGQTLYVVQQTNTGTVVEIQETVKPEVAGPDTISTREEPVLTNVVISESVNDADEVTETGLAELIAGTAGNRKYLALHKSAEPGTILKVRNTMNNREVFVRVIEKLPDTAPNKNILLKISQSAYDRLGAIDPRFLVEVTYFK